MNDLSPIYYKPRRGLSRTEAALYIGISSTKFDELVKEGTMPKPKRLGGRVIWDIRELDDAFDDLTSGEVVPNAWADLE